MRSLDDPALAEEAAQQFDEITQGQGINFFLRNAREREAGEMEAHVAGTGEPISHEEAQARGLFAVPVRGLRDGPVAYYLNPTADLETFLHETSHLQLEIIRDQGTRADATPAQRRALDQVAAALGAERGPDGEVQFTRAQHEQFAELFTHFALTGALPDGIDPSLAGPMRGLTNWFTSLVGEIPENQRSPALQERYRVLMQNRVVRSAILDEVGGAGSDVPNAELVRQAVPDIAPEQLARLEAEDARVRAAVDRLAVAIAGGLGPVDPALWRDLNAALIDRQNLAMEVLLGREPPPPRNSPPPARADDHRGLGDVANEMDERRGRLAGAAEAGAGRWGQSGGSETGVPDTGSGLWPRDRDGIIGGAARHRDLLIDQQADREIIAQAADLQARADAAVRGLTCRKRNGRSWTRC